MATAEAVETEPVEEPVEGDPEEPAEGEEPDTGEPDTGEEPGGAPEDEGPSDEERQRMIDKALEKEHARHERALKALYAEAWESRVMCPLCIGEGFLEPWRPGEVPAEQLEAMDALSGRYTPPEYVEDSDYQRCDHCEGWGHTITGAQNTEHLTKLCDKCSGNGYTKKLYVPTIRPPAAPLPAGVVAATEPVPNYGSSGPDDAWGRPAGHAHYGLDPRYVTG